MDRVVIPLLIVVAVMLFRGQGDSWLMTVARLTGLVAVSLVVVLVLGGLIRLGRW